MEKTKPLIVEYEINSSTMVVMPFVYGSKIYSKIYEYNQESISPFKPLDIIKESCELFGSTFEGRRIATKKLIGATHKVPISISPSIYLFPTASPENSQCHWIAHDHVLEYKKEGKNSTLVTFRNGQTLTIPISVNSFQNQFMRTVMLKSKLTKRYSETMQKSPYKDKYRKTKSAEQPENYELY